MPLVFPSSASIGQTYQSGSSSTYQWTGNYWKVSLVNPSSSVSPATASYAPVVRKNISYVNSIGSNGYLMWLVDGQVYMSKATDATSGFGYLSTLNPSGSTDTARRGISNAFPITFPNETGSIVSASMQAAACYVLFDNGNLYTWGENGYGQLGLGDTTRRFMPTLSTTGVNHMYTHPSVFNAQTELGSLYIKKTDGYVYFTGYRGTYNAGGNTTTNATTWSRIDPIGQNPMSVVRFATFGGGTIAQKADGTIIVAGDNNANYLGINNGGTSITTFTSASGWLHGTSSFTMSAVYGGATWNDGSAGYTNGNMLVLLTSGSTKKLMVCGNNAFGQLGTGNTTAVSTPQTCSLPVSHNLISKISGHGGPVGSYHLLTTTGQVYAWGYNYYGQLGDGSSTDRSTPRLVLTGAVDMYYTDHGTSLKTFINNSPLIKKADGTYVSSGASVFSQLGNGSTQANNTLSLSGSDAVVRFPYGTNLKYAGVVGINTSDAVMKYAVTTDNRVYAWGYNGSYAIYPAYTVNIAVPMDVTPWAFVN